MIDRDLGFYFVCNKSRVKEAQRELPRIDGVRLFHESRAIRHRDDEGNLGAVVGKMMGGLYRDQEVLVRVQEEIERRRLGVSQLKTVDINQRFGTKSGYRRWLETI